MLSAAELYLPDGALFLTQPFYLSLGYTVPAALGAKLAARITGPSSSWATAPSR